VSAPTPNGYQIGDQMLPVFDNRLAFAEALISLAEIDSRIVAVCNDSVGSSNLGAFKERFPERLINVGIAEQNMVGVGAGLANAGMIPFVCGAGPFLTGRALEQVKADVAYSQLPVILCGMSPGMAYGELGPTHHSVEDLSWLRALPGLDIVIPVDEIQTRQAIRWAAKDPHPMYIRVGRHKVPNVLAEGVEFAPGLFQKLSSGNDVAILAAGTMVSRALAAKELLLKDGVSATVVNVPFIAPFDAAGVKELAMSHKLLISVEEANISGGLGAAIAVELSKLPNSPKLVVLGTTDWSPTLSTEALFEHFGLTAHNIAAKAKQEL
jgi:transketolase